MTKTNPLLDYFEHNDDRLIHKWMHYFDIYHRHFEAYRGKPVTILEFGVFQGGSLQMWKHYFGKQARIVGVDINPACKQFEEERVQVEIGDQEDRDFLKSLVKKIGPIDVVIEDGGHTMGQQIATFEEIYPHVAPDGVFLIEDLHTSYWREYGGGYRKSGTFIEYAKDLTDQLNAWHSRDSESFQVDAFTQTTDSMHVYDSIIVFEKARRNEPYHRKTGKATIDS
jgi:SAM-dependent methyltransferase